jgi:hypothetical protein
VRPPRTPTTAGSAASPRAAAAGQPPPTHAALMCAASWRGCGANAEVPMLLRHCMPMLASARPPPPTRAHVTPTRATNAPSS